MLPFSAVLSHTFGFDKYSIINPDGLTSGKSVDGVLVAPVAPSLPAAAAVVDTSSVLVDSSGLVVSGMVFVSEVLVVAAVLVPSAVLACPLPLAVLASSIVPTVFAFSALLVVTAVLAVAVLAVAALAEFPLCAVSS